MIIKNIGLGLVGYGGAFASLSSITSLIGTGVMIGGIAIAAGAKITAPKNEKKDAKEDDEV